MQYSPPPGLLPASITVTGTTTTGLLSAGSIATSGTLVGGAMILGGTVGRWAFGTSGLTSGIGTFATGLIQVISANALPVGANIGAGTLSSLQLDMSLAGAGSVIIRGLAAALPFGANGTVAWAAFGL